MENGNVSPAETLHGIHGMIVPGGFGSRGIEGKINAIQYAREQGIPYLGLCYGMQLATIEYARNVCGMSHANTTEVNPSTPFPIIDLLPEQNGVQEKGATMRLGGNDVLVKSGTRAEKMFGPITRLRFRHRYEVNPLFIADLERNGIIFSGRAPDKEIMQIMELSKEQHPFFMGTQAHPELTSRLENPSPFFLELIREAVQRKELFSNEQALLRK
jgi:CTP synthase